MVKTSQEKNKMKTTTEGYRESAILEIAIASIVYVSLIVITILTIMIVNRLA